MIKPKISDALVSQIDVLASFSAFLKRPVPAGDAKDSENLIDAFLGKSNNGRSVYVEQGGALASIKDGWKYITPNKGAAYDKLVGIETGNSSEPQLYNLNKDVGEKHNLAAQYPEKVKELDDLLSQVKEKK